VDAGGDPVELMLLMGGPGGPRPPGGGVTGAEPPLRGVVEDRRAGTRGETSPLLTFTSNLRYKIPLFISLRMMVHVRIS
jgi:hypothetical protein